MESSRIYIRNLPPGVTNEEFRKHFSMGGFPLTDSKVIPQRRIGYIGFKSPQDAARAVKYFNKTFIRTSRIGVELARSVEKQDESKSKRKRNGDLGPNKLHDRDQNKKAKRLVMDMDNDKDAGLGKQAEPIEDTARARAKSIDDEASQHDTQPHPQAGPSAKDEDWLHSRTSRLLDLEDENGNEDSLASEQRPDNEQQGGGEAVLRQPSTDASSQSGVKDGLAPEITEASPPTQADKVHGAARLFVRNISYTATEDDIRAHFETVAQGFIDEVHLSTDRETQTSKGIAFVQCKDTEVARKLMETLDGKPFQGRLLHILPAEGKRRRKTDDLEVSKLPLKKQQQLKRKSEAGSSSFNWNSLYLNTDAVMSSIAERLGITKTELLDPTSSDAAVRQAHAETHVVQETKSYFLQNGVDLDAFQKKERGDTAILIKNFPFDVKGVDLKGQFEEFGIVSKFLMPPSGTIAIVEYEQADNARAAYRSLAYRKIGGSILFLEKAPKDLFSDRDERLDEGGSSSIKATTKASAADLLARGAEEAVVDTTTLFIGNISFSTTTDRLVESFRSLEGFLSAKVKTKPDPKKKGSLLSMGIGFVEFKTKQQAQAGLLAMDGYKLDGHALKVRASKSLDAADDRRREDRDKKLAGRRTKIIIKNLPFEVSKKDVRSLFGTYGQLRSVRVPRKIDSASRGFAFAEFITAEEAENAMDALKNTHLLGRRLVLDFAAEDIIDPEKEIEAMQQKVGQQANNIAIQKLTGTGRKKFNVDDDHDPEAL